MEQEKRLLAKIARMYYENDMTQKEIADYLGIYRTTVSRMLKKAKQEGIVKIKIEAPSIPYLDMEYELERIFGLKEIVIVPTEKNQSREERKKQVGKAGAELLKRIIKDQDVVGCAWGTTMAELADQIEEAPKRDAEFIPLVGGSGMTEAKYHINTIVFKIAQAFGSASHFIDAIAVVKSKETKAEIISSNYYKKIRDLWDKLTIAVVGVGDPVNLSYNQDAGFYTPEEIVHFQQTQVTGELCSRFVDAEGNLLNIEVNERTIGIEIERLRELSYSIGIAESIEKVPAIMAVLKGKFINVLVTTDQTAEVILQQMKSNP